MTTEAKETKTPITGEYEEGGYFDEDGFWVEGKQVVVEFTESYQGTPTYENMGQFNNLNR